jgi:hypothetical protein
MKKLLLFVLFFFVSCNPDETSTNEPKVHLVNFQWETYGAPVVISVQSSIETTQYYGQWTGTRLTYKSAGEYYLRITAYSPYNSIWVRAKISIDGELCQQQLSGPDRLVSAEIRCQVKE